MKLKDRLVTMLGGRTSDEYNALEKKYVVIATDYEVMKAWGVRRDAKLQELIDQLSRMHVTPIRSEMLVDVMMVSSVEDSVLQKRAEQHFSEDIGNYLVANDLVKITRHRNARGDLVFQANISIIDSRYVEEEK